MISQWESVHFLFQLTSDEIKTGSQSTLDFGTPKIVNNSIIESYLFFALALTDDYYSRSDIADITREINKIFPMPVLILFCYGKTLTLSVINRRLSKVNQTKDVLEKVTLVKDINYSDPLRAHIEILYDLSLDPLYQEYYFHNFVGLHQAWGKRLASFALNERFYHEIADWYFWALKADGVVLPRSIQSIPDSDEREKQQSMFFIRLLTRLIFCWFLQEKGFLPRDLFRYRVAESLLKDFSSEAGTYYKAFLQNLFFATLNQEREHRGWCKKYQGSRDANRGVSNLWRYHDMIATPDQLETLLKDQIPFINGGLFDCLDDIRDDGKTPNLRLDDFSDEKDNNLCLPNELFWGEEREVDLSGVYEDSRHKKEKVRGLIEILSRYKFTVEENTPLEEEIALDPELLGKVFENLLASYNEDTSTTARKAFGAFFTPREIVSYMVDESLFNYLANRVPSISETQLRSLFKPDIKTSNFSPLEKIDLVRAIGTVKILDPACGSGAFPMGALHRLVDLLQKLDPNNEKWKQDRLEEAEKYYELLRQINASRNELIEVEARIEDISHSFDTRFHALDFARKLYLIENCIYGADIQPIACQIAKLRFFISLIVDQRIELQAPNLGVRPLPNLETKIVAADTTVGVRQLGQQLLRSSEIDAKEAELRRVRERHFMARTPETKSKCRDQDAKLRVEIADLLKDNGWDTSIAQKLASWDPYDQNHASTFFDSEWMFGLPIGKVNLNRASPATILGHLSLVNQAGGQMELSTPVEVESGFDIVIGNPPYVRIQTLKQQDRQLVEFYKKEYDSAKKGNYDLYVVFVEVGLRFLKPDGHLAYILPHKFFNSQYGESLRELLSKGRHLQHIVHFGDQQVFPGSTNYVCLLFLAKAGVESCRFVRVDNRETWLKTFNGTEGIFPARIITSDEWNFTVGRGSSIFNYLRSIPQQLGNVADIFVGLQTSADDVYILQFIDRSPSCSSLFSKSLRENVELEDNLLHPLVSGADVGDYNPLPKRQYILFPYEVIDEQPNLIPFKRIQKTCLNTANYLSRNRSRLEARENSKFSDESWYRFGRNQNLGIQGRSKICVPRLVNTLHAAIDLNGQYFLDNVDVCGATWKPEYHDRSLQLIMALLNSAVLRWYFPQISAPFRGGYRSANRQFLSLLPIVLPEPTQETIIVRLVNHLLWLNQYFQSSARDKSNRDVLMLGYFEQLLNGLIYELYFSDELHARNLYMFDLVKRASLSELKSISEQERINRLREEFERIYDLQHPLRSALHDLQTIEIVRIIESKL